jgi:hypothetical protein
MKSKVARLADYGYLSQLKSQIGAMQKLTVDLGLQPRKKTFRKNVNIGFHLGSSQVASVTDTAVT